MDEKLEEKALKKKVEYLDSSLSTQEGPWRNPKAPLVWILHKARDHRHTH